MEDFLKKMGGALVKDTLSDEQLHEGLQIAKLVTEQFGLRDIADLDVSTWEKEKIVELLQDVQRKVTALGKETDPWYEKSDEDVFQELKEEVELLELTVDSPDMDVDVDLRNLVENEASGAAISVNISEQELSVRFTALERFRIVTLQMEGNTTTSASAPFSCGAPWLRALSLNAVRVEMVDLRGLLKLVQLDLSYTDLSNTKVDLAVLSESIRSLSMDGCSLTDLPDAVSQLSFLQFLSARENQIREPIACLSKLSSLLLLEELWLSENPFVEESASMVRLYHENASKVIPSLKILDNKILNQDAGNLNYAAIAGFKEDMNRNDTVADQNEDRGSCSCLEGTPCEVEYTCKDWKHRFEIAEFARRNPH